MSAIASKHYIVWTLEAVGGCGMLCLWIVCQNYFARLAWLPRLATMPALSKPLDIPSKTSKTI